MHNSHCVRRSLDSSCKVSHGVFRLFHDCNVTQLGFLPLRHAVHAQRNTVSKCNLFQRCFINRITETTHRLDFARDAAFEFLHCIFNRDVIERGNVVTELCEVFRHSVRLGFEHAKARCNLLEHTLIPHPLGNINADSLVYRLCIFKGTVCRITHSYAE